MKQKHNAKSQHMSIRVPAALASAVTAIATRTGWSDSRALVWLGDLGNRVLQDPSMTTDQARRELDAWTQRHNAEQKADRMKREAAAAVRAVLGGKPPRRPATAKKPAAKSPAA